MVVPARRHLSQVIKRRALENETVGKCGGALVHDLKSIATDGTPGLHLRQFHH